jgi:hypothetical protein
MPIRQPDPIGTWLKVGDKPLDIAEAAMTVGPELNATETSPAWTASATRSSSSPG